MKRKIILTAAIVIALSLATYGSVAYFTASDVARNVVTSGGIDIELLEWADENKTEPFPEEGKYGVMPGSEVVKIAEIKNIGGNDAYIRVSVEKKVVLQDGTEGDASPVSLDFNLTDWAYKDGFYYYSKALRPGETTEPLFTKVVFDASMDDVYQNGKAVADVRAYATQVDNNGGNPLEAQGWPAV